MVYDPRIGRFLSPDPTEEQGGDNLYEYARNDPIDWDDPSGMAPQPATSDIARNYNDVSAMAGTFGANTMGLYGTVAQVEMGLYGQANADAAFDKAHGGWFAAAGIPSDSQLLLDNILRNPSAITSSMNAGAASAYLAGKSSTPTPTKSDIGNWQYRLAIQSGESIEQSMVGWHEDVPGAQRWIPGWGTALQAVADFKRGDIVLGIARSVNAAFEATGAFSLARSGIRMIATGLADEGGQLVTGRLSTLATPRSGHIINPFARSAGFTPAAEEGLASGALRELTPQEAGVVAPPDHHLFPQQYRAWFAQRGIDVDQYTVTLDQATHDALHWGSGPGLGGGWWNDTLMNNLYEAEAKLGRRLTSTEILQEGNDMLQRVKLDDLPIHPWNSTK